MSALLIFLSWLIKVSAVLACAAAAVYLFHKLFPKLGQCADDTEEK